ncbi:MAG: Minf_1886 family protein [Planctomycetota bacterium]
MLDPSHPISELLRTDRRYKLDAYALVFEALNYAQSVLEMGQESPSEPAGEEKEADSAVERHVSGQDLCEAIRQLAIEQYGYMAKTVLNSWGIHNTGDFGEIVFSLIRIGQMRKTASDRREDFENVYDFDSAFRDGFRIEASE